MRSHRQGRAVGVPAYRCGPGTLLGILGGYPRAFGLSEPRQTWAPGAPASWGTACPGVYGLHEPRHLGMACPGRFGLRGPRPSWPRQGWAPQSPGAGAPRAPVGQVPWWSHLLGPGVWLPRRSLPAGAPGGRGGPPRGPPGHTTSEGGAWVRPLPRRLWRGGQK